MSRSLQDIIEDIEKVAERIELLDGRVAKIEKEISDGKAGKRRKLFREE